MSTIAELNDRLRRTLLGGRVYLTSGIAALAPNEQSWIVRRVRAYAKFSEENDPHGEHDFGSFVVDGRNIIWKIDYYDRDFRFGSPDPSDPAVTGRVLTIMLAEEY